MDSERIEKELRNMAEIYKEITPEQRRIALAFMQGMKASTENREKGPAA